MNLTILDHNIALIEQPDLVITTEQEALDLIAEAGELGARAIILPAENLSREFFDLRSGVAGNILNKFSTYRMQLAVIGDFGQYQSQSLAAMIREANRGNLIFFVSDLKTAKRYLLSQS